MYMDPTNEEVNGVCERICELHADGILNRLDLLTILEVCSEACRRADAELDEGFRELKRRLSDE